MATRRRVTPQRRKLIWARQPAVDFTIGATGGTTNIDLLANFETAYGAQLIGCTVMRIRGIIMLTSPTAQLVPVVAGIMVTNGGPVPLTTLLGPIASPHSDWMAYLPLYWSHGSNTTGQGFPTMVNHEFDVKSMRKLDELNQSLVLSLQAHPGSTAINGSLTISTLVALP